MSKKIPTGVFLYYDRAVRVPDRDKRMCMAVGFARWHLALPEANSARSAGEMVIIVKPILERLIEFHLPDTPFILIPNMRWVAVFKIEQGASPGCKHWSIFFETKEDLEALKRKEESIWKFPYGS